MYAYERERETESVCVRPSIQKHVLPQESVDRV